MPVRSTAGSGRGVVMPGVSQPALPQEDPAATLVDSMTETSAPCSWRYQAVDSPTMPAPMTAMRCGGVVVCDIGAPLLVRARGCFHGGGCGRARSCAWSTLMWPGVVVTALR